VATWSRECLKCQSSKVTKHVNLSPQHILVPARRFAHINLDIVGPLPTCQGYSHLLTIVDRSMRWPEVFPLSDTSAATCANTLFSGWIARYGVPDQITSDRGPQFTSAVWQEVCKFLGIKHVLTTAYHPQGNGMVERMHRWLKEALRARGKTTWLQDLPWVLLGLSATPREDTNVAPSELVFGSQLVLPGQFLNVSDPDPGFYNKLHAAMSGFATNQTRHNNKPEVSSDLPRDLQLACEVWVRKDGPRRPLEPLYTGPFQVVEKNREYFKIQMGERVESVSTSRLKPARMPPGAQHAQPPRRGRPKRVRFRESGQSHPGD
jgi:transposase InsO family protein